MTPFGASYDTVEQVFGQTCLVLPGCVVFGVYAGAFCDAAKSESARFKRKSILPC